MYKYNIEKIINGVNNIKLSKKDRAIALAKSEYGVPLLYGIFVGTFIAIAIPCFWIYICNWKSILSWIFSSTLMTFSIYHFLAFTNKNNFFAQKLKVYIICKEEIDNYIQSLPPQYKDEAINKLADETWSDGGNLSAKGFFKVYNHFLPKITEINEKEFKEDFVTSFSEKDTSKNEKKLVSFENKQMQ